MPKAHQWIVAELVKNHQKYGGSNWDSLDIRSRHCEAELARRTLSENASKEEREFAKETESQFTKVFTDAIPHFKKLFDEGTERPTSADGLLSHLNVEGGAFLTMAANLYEKAVGVRPTEEQVRTFVTDCPPFLAMMLGLVHAQFEWAGIREKPVKKDKRVGRIDLFCSIYLPYCDLYITDDDEQRWCLNEIALTAKLPVEILSFTDFRAGLLFLLKTS
jgi:hypothetical protein